MANPQIENGKTEIANELMDAFCRFRIPGEERQIVDSIIRKTYGWHKTEDAISLSQFVEMTGLNKPHIIKAIKNLVKKRVIIVIAQKGNAPAKVYGINKNYDEWVALPKKATIVTKKGNDTAQPPEKTGGSDDQEPLPKKVIVTKKGNSSLPKKVPTKATITKASMYYIPEWLSRDSWDRFVDMRIEKKAPLNENAADLIIKKLERLRRQPGQDPNEILNESVINEWKGIFPLKEGGRNGNGNGSRPQNYGHGTSKAPGKAQSTWARSDDQPYPIDGVCTE